MQTVKQNNVCVFALLSTSFVHYGYHQANSFLRPCDRA